MKMRAEGRGAVWMLTLGVLLGGCGGDDEAGADAAGPAGDAAIDPVDEGAGGAGGTGGSGGMGGADRGIEADAGGCGADLDCPAGAICGSDGACVPGCRDATGCAEGEDCVEGVCTPVGCDGDAACPPDAWCDTAAGECRPGCRLDEPCPDGAEGEARGCDPTTRMCVALVPCCTAEGDCMPALPGTCDGGSCNEQGCPGAQICGDDGACVEPAACTDDVDCLGERLCVRGVCADRCVDDAGCPGSRACVEGRCPEPAMCFGALDCDPGRVCDDGGCRAACGPEAPCPGAQTCDDETGLCAEPAMCVGDDDCRGERRCASGVCESPCLMDADCPAARVCELGQCGEPPVCFGDADCDPGRLCADGACVEPCGPANPCPGAQQCGGDGRCVERDGCEADADCVGDRICLGGQCGARCVEAADCPGSRSCEVETGRCPEASPCFGPADCDAGRICRDGACLDACGADAPCPGRQTCGADGQCRDAEVCVDDVDCVAGVCQAGACGAGCVEDADCPGTRTCDVASGRCPEAAFCIVPDDCDPGRLCDGGACRDGCDAERPCPGGGACVDGACVAPVLCEADGECEAGQICVLGACRDPECVESGECPEACVGGVCAARPTVECPDCPVGQLCAGGVCVRDGRCEGDADCPAARPICHPAGRCVECLTAAQCPALGTCEAFACEPGFFCRDDADCAGERFCDGACRVPACVDDVYAPPFAEALAARVYPELVLCDGTMDRFLVTLAEGEGLEARIQHAADRDLALAIEDGPRVFRSDGVGLEEVVGVPGGAARSVTVSVVGGAGYSVDYTLDLTRVGGEGCPPDGMGGGVSNDVPERAVLLSAHRFDYAARVCPGEVDYFAVTLAAGNRATITAAGPTGDVELALLDAGGEVAAMGPGSVTLDVVESGRYVVQVTPVDAPPSGVAYAPRVMFDVDGAAADPACAEAQPLALDTPTTRPTYGTGRFAASCNRRAAGDAVSTLTLDAPTRIRLRSEADDVTLSLRAECALGEDAEQSCIFAGGPPIDLAAGVYFAVVSSGQPEAPIVFELEAVAQVCAGDGACPEGLVCTVDGCLPPCVEGCPGAQACVDERCVEPDVCDDDDDCVGRRVCLANACGLP